jgi:cytochrome c oxidase cbb3-type subunit I/II
MEDPRSISPGSNMPSYPWLLDNATDYAALPSKLSAQRTLGVPYPEISDEEIQAQVDEQATAIAENLKAEGIYVAPDKQIVALIAYLQQLGNFEKVTPATASATGNSNL